MTEEDKEENVYWMDIRDLQKLSIFDNVRDFKMRQKARGNHSW